MKFPSIINYEKAISLGEKSFANLTNIQFTPSSKIGKVTIYTFGAGQFAVVFKAKMSEKNYALRCFQKATKKSLEKYKIVSSYLKKKNLDYFSEFKYYENEIKVEGKYYPVILMEWIDGESIHSYIGKNIKNKKNLSKIQDLLCQLSKDLEKNKIGHGDLQSGNISIINDNGEIKIKLLDYDGIYVPGLSQLESNELGKPDFQHPKRKKEFFNEKIDRFSIWVLLTAIEAIKYDETLWDRISDGGYNDLSNFCFLSEDFRNPNNSKLFDKLINSNHESVEKYAKKLKQFCLEEDVSKILKPKILGTSEKSKKDLVESKNIILDSKLKEVISTIKDKKNNNEAAVESKETKKITNIKKGYVLINSEPEGAAILNLKLNKLGTTPSQIDLNEKKVIVSYGKQTRQVNLKKDAKNSEINIKFEKRKEEKKINNVEKKQIGKKEGNELSKILKRKNIEIIELEEKIEKKQKIIDGLNKKINSGNNNGNKLNRIPIIIIIILIGILAFAEVDRQKNYKAKMKYIGLYNTTNIKLTNVNKEIANLKSNINDLESNINDLEKENKKLKKSRSSSCSTRKKITYYNKRNSKIKVNIRQKATKNGNWTRFKEFEMVAGEASSFYVTTYPDKKVYEHEYYIKDNWGNTIISKTRVRACKKDKVYIY
tara:strand:+ start:230 stop:2197 length:1968 start_codon:yes stop_codon:yes gene_type:complete